uniref:Uncharacterized protein n=1 Tax=Arundo donax TaxID=35708 RepID=A0A0A9GKP4_ARUDO
MFLQPESTQETPTRRRSTPIHRARTQGQGKQGLASPPQQQSEPSLRSPRRRGSWRRCWRCGRRARRRPRSPCARRRRSSP